MKVESLLRLWDSEYDDLDAIPVENEKQYVEEQIGPGPWEELDEFTKMCFLEEAAVRKHLKRCFEIVAQEFNLDLQTLYHRAPYPPAAASSWDEADLFVKLGLIQFLVEQGFLQESE